jgi:hypothetical protein
MVDDGRPRALDSKITLSLFAALLAAGLAACPEGMTTDLEGHACMREDDDESTGRCCEVLPGRDMSRIPHVEDDAPQGTSDLRLDPAFDCDDLTCVAHRGTSAYCTRDCDDDEHPCPSGFSCNLVLLSSMSGTTFFCQSELHECSLCK